MKPKITYKAKKIKQINFNELKEKFAGEALVLAIDVAKNQQYGLLTNQDHTSQVLIQWDLSSETRQLIEEMSRLNSPVTVVMESTGSYGEPLRYQFSQQGYEIYQVSCKRVHDSREILDGVPSLHDAKAAYLIARLHKEGLTKPWHNPTPLEKELSATHKLLKIYEQQYQDNSNRLEACLAAIWPEVSSIIDLDSVTLEQLLKTYGSPENIIKQEEEARQLMRTIGKTMLKEEKRDAIIESARHTLGVPCDAAMNQYLKSLVAELEHNRLGKQAQKRSLEASIDNDTGLEMMSTLIGRVTLAVLLSAHLDPRHFKNVKSFVKALGLNLTEKSSGTYKGRVHLSKRGNSTARKYLYMATLRLLQSNEKIWAWYQQKQNPKAKIKTVIALMRKLCMALWHVGQGEVFDVEKLIDLRIA